MTENLFKPFNIKSLKLKNRIVMAPMTRGFSPNGVPTPEVAAYYRRRALGSVGLLVTEGTVVNRPSSANSPSYPHFYGEEALAGWQEVVDQVHEAGGKIAPQIWHQGIVKPLEKWRPDVPFEGPSGLVKPKEKGGDEMTAVAIQETIAAYVQSAVDAAKLGFDVVELHGAHGYLIDQFFWKDMNERTDEYGGATFESRSKFAVEIVKGIRAALGQDFPIILRISQWKQQDYKARLANSPEEIEQWLKPLVEAGVDIFHCSQRRYWEPEFEDSDLNFAGWVKKITGCPTITVGSVGLSGDFMKAFQGEGAAHRAIDSLLTMLDRGDFDLVAVGRALLADANWAEKIRDNRLDELRGFDKSDLAKLT